jgi:hypothetical protein
LFGETGRPKIAVSAAKRQREQFVPADNPSGFPATFVFSDSFDILSDTFVGQEPFRKGKEFKLRLLDLDGDDAPLRHIHVLPCQQAILNTTVAIAGPEIRTAPFRHMQSLAQKVHLRY